MKTGRTITKFITFINNGVSKVKGAAKDIAKKVADNIYEKTTITVFTAFSGYDSQCMAFRELAKCYPELFDFDLAGWSEVDPYAIAAHNIIFPEYKKKFYGDISTIDWSKVEDFNVFFSSSPCQDISNEGKQAGLDEDSQTRSSLIWQCEKPIAVKRPDICILENVKNLVSKKFMHVFLLWQRRLDSYGYDSIWYVLDAQDHDIPQHRERVFMVSIKRGSKYEGQFKFPGARELGTTPLDFLETKVDDKYYLDNAHRDFVLKTIKDAKIDDDVEKVKVRKHDAEITNNMVGKLVKRELTYTCSNDKVIPTLLAGGNSGDYSSFTGCFRDCCPGVIEVWKKSSAYIII